MKTVYILENEDAVLADDWCRPLALVSMSGGASDSYSFYSQYTGQPENNVKWAKVSWVFGECWFGGTVKQLNGKFTPYEFMRGDIPESHVVNYKPKGNDRPGRKPDRYER